MDGKELFSFSRAQFRTVTELGKNHWNPTEFQHKLGKLNLLTVRNAAKPNSLLFQCDCKALQLEVSGFEGQLLHQSSSVNTGSKRSIP